MEAESQRNRQTEKEPKEKAGKKKKQKKRRKARQHITNEKKVEKQGDEVKENKGMEKGEGVIDIEIE